MKELSLTSEFLNQCLIYCPETGIFRWKKRPENHFKNLRSANAWNARYADKVAGAITHSGYIAISLNNKLFFAHRLAWFMYYGVWPQQQIDHKNRNKQDNSIFNLRDISSSHNHFNRGFLSNNKSGCNGVSYCNNTKTWCSYFGKKRLGRFKTVEEAIQSRIDYENNTRVDDYGVD
ncbi:HNH endonuclease [Citrobacter cronae]|uniref:HNH endonuclease signature motif containing protein n=1 Tax=Citrobacter cronae TaxID=1748967 RepID=UPI001900BD37|nr:HNH endonuclease signature motif containing protein [Citrobacter cronae]MBJ8378401.1 HNH endonuclease [Citrobacter cronae]